MLKTNRRIAPFILAFGSTVNLQFSEFFVIISDYAIPCGTKFLKAFDTCFKCFTVLNIPPPVESFDHWKFIINGICGMPYEAGHLSPVVKALIGQIMPRL